MSPWPVARPKESKSADTSAAKPAEVTVDATDTDCKLSATEAGTGPTTFVITNNGTKVTEFYVYGEGGRVLGEVENVSPGLQRRLVVQLGEPGTYQTACKPGMVGDGIRADFTVKGAAFRTDDNGQLKKVSADYKAYVVGQTDELDHRHKALSLQPSRPVTSRTPRRVPEHPHLLRTHRAGGRVVPGQPRPAHRPARGRPRAGTTLDRFPPPREGPVGDRAATGHQCRRRPTARRRQGTPRAVEAPDYTIHATQIAGGAQGLLDEVAASKITGEEDIFSHTDLWDFYANVEGSRTAVGAVRPVLDQRDAELGKRVDGRFEAVESMLDKYRKGDGFVSYDTVTEPQRQELSRAIDALGKEVSQVQGAIAPQ